VVLPLAYVAATVRASQAAPQAPVAAPPPPPAVPSAPAPPRTPAQPRTPVPPGVRSAYLDGLGTVTAAFTLQVRSRVDGELKSLGFEEGKPVQAGQLLATVDAQNTQSLLDRAQRDLAADQRRLNLSAGEPSTVKVQIEAQIKADQRDVENFERVLSYGQIRAPFAGVAGLRKVDPGNLVRTGDLIVVITQLQPIAVLISIPEDYLPRLMARMQGGTAPTVEAWNRDNSAKLATGTLTAVDNEIDKTSGTATLKATFENTDGALFPGQFVNARVLMNGR
jgi:membrane fusion protein, multidrug efflux system